MAKKDIVGSEKKFLTKHIHQNSSIHWYIMKKSKKASWTSGGEINAEIVMRDCSEQVSLHMGCKPSNYKMTRKKIRTLIESLEKFEKLMLQEMDQPIEKEKDDD